MGLWGTNILETEETWIMAALKPPVMGNSRADQLARQLPLKGRLFCLDPEAAEG